MTIQIEVGLHNNLGWAEAAGKRYTGRSIAEAMSILLGKLARFKELKGQPWECRENGLRGIIGETKKKRPVQYINVAELGLVGGQMRG